MIIRGDFLPIQLRVFGLIFLCFPILFLQNKTDPLSIGLILSGLVLASARFGTFINPESKTIKKYLSVLLLRIGRTKNYDLLTCFWLKAHRMQSVWQNQAVQYVTPEFGVFDVYLVTSDGENHYLFEAKSKQEVYQKLSKAMQTLNIKCLDKLSL